jgi:hypothetical protein
VDRQEGAMAAWIPHLLRFVANPMEQGESGRILRESCLRE